MRVKLIYGTDTGNTEAVIDNNLLTELEDNGFEVETIGVHTVKPEDWNHDKFILGIPTWYDGELQSDWEDYFNLFKAISFKDKTVAIFGLGDQLGYDEWFCDGIGILAKVVIENGGKIVGYTKKDDSYDLDTEPLSLKDENTFYGLCLDEDNQDELTEERIENWVKILAKEL
jgi:flavodoxin I